MSGEEVIHVFVGASPGGLDAEACMVCEASLRARASVPVEVSWLAPQRDKNGPLGGWRTERWATPWTALRWAVPALCGGVGRAVYLDCPTIVLGDVAELAAAEFPEGRSVLARREGTTMLNGCLVFDCAACVKWFPSIQTMKADVGAHQTVGAVLERRKMVADLPQGWGLTDRDYALDPDADVRSVHCSRTAMQPHQEYARARLARVGQRHWFGGVYLPHHSRRLSELFALEYAQALEAGYTVEQYVSGEAAKVEGAA